MFPRAFLAAALVRLDRPDDADWQILQLETDHPDLTLSRLEKCMPITDGPHKTRLFEDLRTEGMSK